MGGCRCSYKHCVRSTKNSERQFHFFHYPVGDKIRCAQWITNANKPHFKNLPRARLRNKVICQLHFESNAFSNLNKKRLVHNAVPTLDAGAGKTPINEVKVNILQTDADGNVFTVDTNNFMPNEIRDISTYMIQNGNIVPTHVPLYADGSNDQLISYQSNNNEFETGDTKDEIALNTGTAFPTGTAFHTGTAVQANVLYQTLDDLSFQNYVDIQPFDKPSEVIIDENLVDEDPEEVEEMDMADDSYTTEMVRMSNLIGKHSKQIASLKQAFKSNMRRLQYNPQSIRNRTMAHLRRLAPASLCGAVSLHLNIGGSNYNKEERDFLTSLYKASPEAYTVLKTTLNWNLPDTNTVEELIADSGCFS